MAEANTPAPEAPKTKKQRSLLRELPFLIGIALVLALLIKTFLVQAFFIPSESMENTLLVGDRVLVNKLGMRLGGDIKRGQIVVFKDPGGWLGQAPVQGGNAISRGLQEIFEFFGLMPSADQGDLIKRVIAVGGDQVKCCDEGGRIEVNGVALDEPYVYPGNAPGDAAFQVVVPKGRLWVMGDHRSVSRDSTKHMADPGGGAIPEDDVVGRAFVRLWPLDRVSRLPVPETFERKALDAAGGFGGASPFAAGLVVALPIVAIRRRRRHRTATSS
jgi:signal peptidase I